MADVLHAAVPVHSGRRPRSLEVMAVVVDALDQLAATRGVRFNRNKVSYVGEVDGQWLYEARPLRG